MRIGDNSEISTLWQHLPNRRNYSPHHITTVNTTGKTQDLAAGGRARADPWFPVQGRKRVPEQLLWQSETSHSKKKQHPSFHPMLSKVNCNVCSPCHHLPLYLPEPKGRRTTAPAQRCVNNWQLDQSCWKLSSNRTKTVSASCKKQENTQCTFFASCQCWHNAMNAIKFTPLINPACSWLFLQQLLARRQHLPLWLQNTSDEESHIFQLEDASNSQNTGLSQEIYFQLRKRTAELWRIVLKKTLTSALSSLCLLTYTTQTFHTSREGPLLALMHWCPMDEDFLRELRLWISPYHKWMKRLFSRSQSGCDPNHWTPTLHITIQFLTTDCMTKFHSCGRAFHAVSHRQVSNQEKHLAKEYLTQD